jgi:hypothetical protein
VKRVRGFLLGGLDMNFRTEMETERWNVLSYFEHKILRRIGQLENGELFRDKYRVCPNEHAHPDKQFYIEVWTATGWRGYAKGTLEEIRAFFTWEGKGDDV